MKLVQFAFLLVGMACQSSGLVVGDETNAPLRRLPNRLSVKLQTALESQTAGGLFERELSVDAFDGKGKGKKNSYKSTGNNANGNYANVGGGAYNQATGAYTAIGGGFGNVAEANGTTIDGGQNNTASGFSSTVAGGDFNTASGASSFVIGYHGSALDDDSAVFAFTGSASAGCRSQGPGTVSICAPNGLFVNGINVNNASNVPYLPDPVEEREAIEGRSPWDETDKTSQDSKIAELQAKNEKQDAKIEEQEALISALRTEMTKLKIQVLSIISKDAK